MLRAETIVGKPPLYLSKLGSQWRGRLCCHTDKRERKVTRSITSVQGTYICCSRYRLVRIRTPVEDSFGMLIFCAGVRSMTR